MGSSWGTTLVSPWGSPISLKRLSTQTGTYQILWTKFNSCCCTWSLTKVILCGIKYGFWAVCSHERRLVSGGASRHGRHSNALSVKPEIQLQPKRSHGPTLLSHHRHGALSRRRWQVSLYHLRTQVFIQVLEVWMNPSHAVIYCSKIKYLDDDRFKQSSNPLDMHADTGSIEGFEGIATPPGRSFGSFTGLRKSHSDLAALDGHAGKVSFYCAMFQ